MLCSCSFVVFKRPPAPKTPYVPASPMFSNASNWMQLVRHFRMEVLFFSPKNESSHVFPKHFPCGFPYGFPLRVFPGNQPPQRSAWVRSGLGTVGGWEALGLGPTAGGQALDGSAVPRSSMGCSWRLYPLDVIWYTYMILHVYVHTHIYICMNIYIYISADICYM